ncbi:MAG: type I-E CRISPR-associated protein Cas7/Cse4/CasC [Planctomycetota bacterium]|nr:MAG: type I-E CRISPR-associated protein Cas7/Cse4/CasC [Planctomycetota bacterium]
MSTPRFLQFHLLTPYAASLLNRDDAGFAKRIPFGGSTRTRISSQCLKRHWRTFAGKHAFAELGAPPTMRSRLTFERHVAQPLIDSGVDAERAREVTVQIVKEVLGFNADRAKAKASKAKKSDDAVEETPEDPSVKTDQVTVLGQPELDYILAQAKEICAELASDANEKAITKAVKEHFGREGKANMQAIAKGAGLSAALFGRMVTSDNLARCDAAIHVAHAFTVHEQEAESEFFSAVDDLISADGELGSGHIGTTELTSGLFYGYVAIDLPLLLSNLAGDVDLAAGVIERLTWIMATASPGAKLGSTAPYAYANLVLAESGSSQPRSLANAFGKAVRRTKDESLQQVTQKALAEHLSQLDGMYGAGTERCISALEDISPLAKDIGVKGSIPLAELATWAAAQAKAAAAKGAA